MKENLIKESVDKKAQSGFTLIEVLIVVLIIGILAAIALPQYQLARDKAKYASIKSITATMSAAQERYYMAQGVYASRFSALDISLPEGGVIGSASYGGQGISYDWGYCLINVYLAKCTINKGKLFNEFTIHNRKRTNSGQKHGQVCCAPVSDPSGYYNKFCKAVTGKQNYSYFDDCSTMGSNSYSCYCYYF